MRLKLSSLLRQASFFLVRFNFLPTSPWSTYVLGNSFPPHLLPQRPLKRLLPRKLVTPLYHGHLKLFCNDVCPENILINSKSDFSEVRGSSHMSPLLSSYINSPPTWLLFELPEYYTSQKGWMTVRCGGQLDNKRTSMRMDNLVLQFSPFHAGLVHSQSRNSLSSQSQRRNHMLPPRGPIRTQGLPFPAKCLGLSSSPDSRATDIDDLSSCLQHH